MQDAFAQSRGDKPLVPTETPLANVYAPARGAYGGMRPSVTVYVAALGGTARARGFYSNLTRNPSESGRSALATSLEDPGVQL